jgi:hypothetical protein
VGLPLPTQLCIEEPDEFHHAVDVLRRVACVDLMKQVARFLEPRVQLLKEAVW